MTEVDGRLVRDGLIAIDPETGERRVTQKGRRFLKDRGDRGVLFDPLFYRGILNPQNWRGGWGVPRTVRAICIGSAFIRLTFLMAFIVSLAVWIWHLVGPSEYWWLEDWQREGIHEVIILFGLCWLLLWCGARQKRRA